VAIKLSAVEYNKECKIRIYELPLIDGVAKTGEKLSALPALSSVEKRVMTNLNHQINRLTISLEMLLFARFV
jgi:hypothetical protein